MLSIKHVTNVCLLNGGIKQCRYLEGDEYDDRIYYCKKMTPEKKMIDVDVEELRQEFIDKHKDIRTTGYALGDNCSGYPLLKEMLQGYDV